MIELFLEKVIKIYFEIASKKQKSRKIVEFCRVFGNFQLLFQFVKDNKIFNAQYGVVIDFYYTASKEILIGTCVQIVANS